MKAIKNLVIVLLIGTIIATVAMNGMAANSGISNVKTPDEKIKQSPPTVINGPMPQVSKEEQTLIDQLKKARKAGNVEESKNIVSKLAALQGRKLSYDKPTDAGVVTTTSNKNGPTPNWVGSNYPCVTCSKGYPTGWYGMEGLTHDQNGNLYIGVTDYNNIFYNRIYVSHDKGRTWSEYYSWPSGGKFEPQLTVAGNYLFVVSSISTNEPTNFDIRRINLNDGTMTRKIFPNSNIYPNPKYAPKIVTDHVEWPSDDWMYVIFEDSSNTLQFIRFDVAETWFDGPRPIQYNVWDSVSMDYGNNNLFVAYQSNGNTITEKTGWNFGDSWTSTQLTYQGDATFEPTVAAVKGAGSNGNVIVAYTRNWGNTGDLDVWYAYSSFANNNWNLNRPLAWGSVREEQPSIVTSDSPYTFDIAYRYIFTNIEFEYASYNSPTSWSAPGTVAQVPPNGDIRFPSVTAPSGANFAAVAWADMNSAQVYYNGESVS